MEGDKNAIKDFCRYKLEGFYLRVVTLNLQEHYIPVPVAYNAINVLYY